MGNLRTSFLIFRDISGKTRANIKSCLHSFFKWVSKREKIPCPEFPEVHYELKSRNIISIETQQAIIDEIYLLSYQVNPKIWLAVKWLAIYINARPAELLSIKEKDIDRKQGIITIEHSKEKKRKQIFLHPDDIKLLNDRAIEGLPHLYFFRHIQMEGVKAGRKFGKNYLYKYWKKACNNLNIKDVDLYGGTRHSSATALSEYCTPGTSQGCHRTLKQGI